MNIDCTESEKFYELNRILGLKEETATDEVTSNELDNNKSNSDDRFAAYQNKENNQRYKPLINNPNRYVQATSASRNQMIKKGITNPYSSASAQTTNFNIDRTESITTAANEFIPSTTFPPVNIAQFFELTTRKTGFNPLTTNDNAEYTTVFTSTISPTDLTTGITNTNKYDSNTQIIPELIEESNNNNNADHSTTDEIVESIKQLQKHYPSAAVVDDSREKRFLFKADSIKNRQKLFEMLNQH